MNKPLSKTIVTIIFLMLGSANASECNRNASTLEIRDCLVGELWAQDMKLEKVLNEALNSSSWVAKEIQVSQKSWSDYRDTHCSAVYALSGRGTIRLIEAPACMIELTKQRINTLSKYFVTH